MQRIDSSDIEVDSKCRFLYIGIYTSELDKCDLLIYVPCKAARLHAKHKKIF